MHDPWSRVISFETNGYIVAWRTNADDVALYWVNEIVSTAAGTANDGECMLIRKSDTLF